MKPTPLKPDPKSIRHPGEQVVEYLEVRGWTQRELAKRTGLTPKTINEICRGHAAITVPTALLLEREFERPARFWLSLQNNYDLAWLRKR